jgi:alcohol dehydrogenase class IV
VVDRLGAERVLVVSTPSVERSALLQRVTSALGERVAATFAGSQAHTPEPVVLAAARIARDVDADCLVSLGGSSVVDLTKGVALVLAEGELFPELTVGSGRRLNAPKIPHVAIPTTLSAAEFTSSVGITDPEHKVKELYSDPSLAPRWVVLDSEMTSATPQRLWAGTGMKLVADCSEGMLSSRATPYSDALLFAALEILLADLGAPDDDLEARERCLQAAHMTLSNLHNVGIGAIGALRHQLGGGSGVAHGEAATPTLDRVAGRLGLEDSAGLIAAIEATTATLGLPVRLRDVGVDQNELDAIARHAAEEAAARSNVRPADEAGLRSILDAAW